MKRAFGAFYNAARAVSVVDRRSVVQRVNTRPHDCHWSGGSKQRWPSAVRSAIWIRDTHAYRIADPAAAAHDGCHANRKNNRSFALYRTTPDKVDLASSGRASRHR